MFSHQTLLPTQSTNKDMFQPQRWTASLLTYRQITVRNKGIHETHICAFFQALYDGKWHQLKLLVRPTQVTSFLDDQVIREMMLEPVEPIYINGETQVAKRRGTDITVPVSQNKKRSAGDSCVWLMEQNVVDLRNSFKRMIIEATNNNWLLFWNLLKTILNIE